MKKNELLKIKKNLEDKQIQLQINLHRLHQEKKRIDNPLSNSNADDNSQIFSADLLIDLLDKKDFGEYSLVQQALNKINCGSYGECEECDSKIGLKRLMALPFTKLCIDCASEFEFKKI
jgi:DnaK suppressor protein